MTWVITSPSSGRPQFWTSIPLNEGITLLEPSGIFFVSSLVRTRRVLTSSGAGVLVSITFKRALMTGRYWFLDWRVNEFLAASSKTPEIKYLNILLGVYDLRSNWVHFHLFLRMMRMVYKTKDLPNGVFTDSGAAF